MHANTAKALVYYNSHVLPIIFLPETNDRTKPIVTPHLPARYRYHTGQSTALLKITLRQDCFLLACLISSDWYRPCQIIAGHDFWIGTSAAAALHSVAHRRLTVNDVGGNLLRIVPPPKKGEFFKFWYYATLKVSNIIVMVLESKSHSWASLFYLLGQL